MLYNMSYPRDQPTAATAQSVKPIAPPRPRQRCSQPMPFDPEELSQKLVKVLADQKLYAEKRKRARAEGAAPSLPAAPVPILNGLQDAHPQHTSLAREYLDQGSLKPGQSTMSRTAPPVAKPTKETVDSSSSIRPKSKTSDGDSRSSKSGRKDSSSKRKGSDGDRHPFIPQFAATQFSRTTTTENTSDSKGLVRKLSRTALRLAQGHRERRQDRAPVTHDQIPEMAELSNTRAHRDRNSHRHTIEGPLGVGRSGETDHTRSARRATTGDILIPFESGASSPYQYDNPEATDHNPYEHRVDWTQSDEAQPPPKTKPSLRKADSIWALKHKLGAFARHGREENHSRDNSPPSDTALRSPKSGFFARFKVNH
ncbi:hypothetical protein CORC01_04372 [Colletotrichum orchidophilum]|uniref:Uncharacterized protein n=1 Tax=Colletotrichum orchidophilum TaxID=1209926 RepID=A0A1G4BG85_9PEZI|nr:uncharacterized protein CORC01_04372 [Colletotrichum orchidophilum]OHF00391.1 hypothetical protein CORC01_04372 [Colletotrichum orchidophilum]